MKVEPVRRRKKDAGRRDCPAPFKSAAIDAKGALTDKQECIDHDKADLEPELHSLHRNCAFLENELVPHARDCAHAHPSNGEPYCPGPEEVYPLELASLAECPVSSEYKCNAKTLNESRAFPV